MKTRIDDKYMILMHRVGKIKLLKKLLRIPRDWMLRKVANNRISYFKKNGLKVFKTFIETLDENKIPYSVFYGTLLGAVRDKGPISHDYDFDICIWAEDYSPKLKRCLELNGFKRTRQMLVDDGKSGREETYQRDGVDIDIFYIFKDQEYPSYTCEFFVKEGSCSFTDSMRNGGLVVRRYQIPISRSLISLNFDDFKVKAISNYHEFLKICYGDDYMIPNPNFEPYDIENIRFIWENKRGEYIH